MHTVAKCTLTRASSFHRYWLYWLLEERESVLSFFSQAILCFWIRPPSLSRPTASVTLWGKSCSTRCLTPQLKSRAPSRLSTTPRPTPRAWRHQCPPTTDPTTPTRLIWGAAACSDTREDDSSCPMQVELWRYTTPLSLYELSSILFRMCSAVQVPRGAGKYLKSDMIAHRHGFNHKFYIY